MAKIVCVTSDLAGTLYPALELARRLVRAGHDVHFATTCGARRAVTGIGLPFLPLDESRYPAFLESDSRMGTLQRLRRRRSRRAQAIESLGVGGFASTLRGLEPDLVLIDVELHEHVIAGSACGAPIALLNTFVSIWRQPGLPPPHCQARPGDGWQGSRAGSWLLWRRHRLRQRGRAAQLRARHLGCDRRSLLRQLARDCDFDFRRETDASQWLMPFSYRRLPILSLHALEFDFPHQPPRNVHHVGPMLLETRVDERIDDASRLALRAIFNRCRDLERKLVYAGFGSFFTVEASLVRRLIEAVAGRPDWELLISLGGRLAADDLGPLPERVHAFTWLPQPEVLQRADVAVVHGGVNTVDECVLFGVPMLVFRGSETDMAGNTARILYHGLGIAGDGRRDGPREIAEQLERLLSQPEYRSRVERMRRSFAAYEEDRVAERTVASLLERGGEGAGR